MLAIMIIIYTCVNLYTLPTYGGMFQIKPWTIPFWILRLERIKGCW